MTSNPRHRHDYREIASPKVEPSEPHDGNARRRARTRDLLVTAAQELLSDGTTDPSIQAITERAGVGFGSFFNHFTSKTQLFEVAAAEAFRRADGLLAEQIRHVDDPLERIAILLRLGGRLPEIDPVASRVIAFSPTDTFAMYSGYDLELERNFERAKEAGRLPRPDRAVVRNTFVWGAMKHLILLRVTDVDHPVEWADDFAEIALVVFGVDPAEAADLAHRPLPEPEV